MRTIRSSLKDSRVLTAFGPLIVLASMDVSRMTDLGPNAADALAGVLAGVGSTLILVGLLQMRERLHGELPAPE